MNLFVSELKYFSNLGECETSLEFDINLVICVMNVPLL